MAIDPRSLSEEVLSFLSERHLATLSLVRSNGSPHVTPVGFMWDNNERIVRIITFTGSTKVKLLARDGGGPAAVSQVDGARWLTLEGHATVTTDTTRCAEGVRRYAERYRQVADREDRAVIEIAVTRVLGRV